MAKRTTTYNSIEVSATGSDVWAPLFNNIFYRNFADAADVLKVNEELFAPAQRLRVVSVKLTDAECRNKVFL